MRDMDFDPTGTVGLIVGQSGHILRSENAGYEWVSILPPARESGEEG
jgi:photosystem II stability/assembly factor-like uncharacterized protein